MNPTNTTNQYYYAFGAHYQFIEKKKKPIDVCYEVGFENLSHFSYAFKKHFGYAPTALIGQTSSQ
ncbi:helix-turn-helix domain-containing protein [Dyadobacter sp. LHD-138]|uniref:helix-turn-helix domain-containing protein n=1 Tax=Dyadobacter sp. LHD-138 TaxID=3071413 RepID=UPI0027E13AE4|nr:helix-turn-helix domain-containing protein [Dyadobacter sp. LHD-138]MDQ6482018.1 helix-turn-helix domain-containing protein [Dyadobacter sp. LHD-138]